MKQGRMHFIFATGILILLFCIGDCAQSKETVLTKQYPQGTETVSTSVQQYISQHSSHFQETKEKEKDDRDATSNMVTADKKDTKHLSDVISNISYQSIFDQQPPTPSISKAVQLISNQTIPHVSETVPLISNQTIPSISKDISSTPNQSTSNVVVSSDSVNSVPVLSPSDFSNLSSSRTKVSNLTAIVLPTSTLSPFDLSASTSNETAQTPFPSKTHPKPTLTTTKQPLQSSATTTKSPPQKSDNENKITFYSTNPESRQVTNSAFQPKEADSMPKTYNEHKPGHEQKSKDFALNSAFPQLMREKEVGTNSLPVSLEPLRGNVGISTSAASQKPSTNQNKGQRVKVGNSKGKEPALELSVPRGPPGPMGPPGPPGNCSCPKNLPENNVPELSMRPQAALSAVLTSHFGPSKDVILPFDLELLDLADNYDNVSGVFFCSIPGTYVVSLFLMSHPGSKVNARLFVNSRPVAALWADDSKDGGFYPSSSIQTIAHLTFGDQVYVMLVDGGYGDSWVHANYNSFTVFLLYEDLFPM